MLAVSSHVVSKGKAYKVYDRVRNRLDAHSRAQLTQFAGLRTYFFDAYWKAVAEDLDADLEVVGNGFFRISKGNRHTFVRGPQVAMDDHLTLRIAGNKPLVHRLIRDQGYESFIPQYASYSLDNFDVAEKFLAAQSGNCVVKPGSGSGAGMGITTKVCNTKLLAHASYVANVFSSDLIVEEEIPGSSYRLLYLNGELIDAIRRDSPSVEGDGCHTISELIDIENYSRLCEAPIRALRPLTSDLENELTLKSQGLTLKDIPPEGVSVAVKTAANQNSRFENVRVMDEIHPSIVEFGKKISEVVNVTLSGVDLMLGNCAVPLEESGCFVNEINTTPGLHHHALVSNLSNSVPVGRLVIAQLLAE